MNLQQHLDLLGHDVKHFSFMTKLSESVIQRAIRGEPIAAPHAERIAHKLSNEHALHPGQHLQVSDIEGLHTVTSEMLKGN